MKSLTSVGLAALLTAVFARDGDPTARAAVPAKTAQSDDQDRRPERPIAERYVQIRAEFEARVAADRPAATKAENPRAKEAVAVKRPIDLVADYARRMVDLAESGPDDPAARDALLWVLNRTSMPDTGAYGDQFARAAALLVRRHGDDPEAVRIGLGLDNAVTPRRNALMLGLYAAAKGREAKGLARLALAQYLAKKANGVVYARSVAGRPKRRMISRGNIREFDLTDEQYADHLELRLCDPRALQAEAERLFEEVISEYGDVPHVTRRDRELEALLNEPTPEPTGKPLTAEERRRIKASSTVAVCRASVLTTLWTSSSTTEGTSSPQPPRRCALSSSKRKVALKLIKTGMDSRAVPQRFEQEHQALAIMDHPNIAVVGCRLNLVEFRARSR